MLALPCPYFYLGTLEESTVEDLVYDLLQNELVAYEIDDTVTSSRQKIPAILVKCLKWLVRSSFGHWSALTIV